MRVTTAHLLTLILSPTTAVAQHRGTPTGFATGVTGGGSATPSVPSDINQLKSWLSDNVPRVIMINREFNFIGSEGTVTEQGCRLNTGTCTGANGGQDTIKDTCDSNEVKTTVTYDKAGTSGMTVGSNKSIIGVGSAGVLNGKGLRVAGGAKNVIIQNIHITNLNPKYVWGGDALGIDGVDGLWIDHCKFSKVGRQMIVSHYAASRMTISNNEFDGVTANSHSCNNDHYWGLMLIGPGDKITLDSNYIHDLSGRSPKLGSDSGTQLIQAVNNYFKDNAGHNFDITSNAHVLIEGNYFQNSNQPMTSSSNGVIFNTASTSVEGTCTSYIGRACEVNILTSSGSWATKSTTSVLSEFGSQRNYLVTPDEVSNIASTIPGMAGIGKIGN